MVSLSWRLASGTAEADTIRSIECNTRETNGEPIGGNRFGENLEFGCVNPNASATVPIAPPSPLRRPSVAAIAPHPRCGASIPSRRRPPDPGTPSILPLFSLTSSPSLPASPSRPPLSPVPPPPGVHLPPRLPRRRCRGGGGQEGEGEVSVS